MRILHVLNHVIDEGNGIVNVAVDLAILQRRNGHDVTIASNGGGYESLLAANGVEHAILNQARRPIPLLKAIPRYRHIIDTYRPDIVHVHMMTGAVLCRLFRRRHEYVLVSTVHNEFQRGAILMGLADLVIGVSDSVAASMGKRGVPKRRLHVVKNGTIGSPRRPAITTDLRPLERPAITTVAGLYRRKGIMDLIDAFAIVARAHPDAHLYIVGNGPERSDFEAQAEASAARARIHFEGFQRGPERYLLATDIFVLASHRDPFPLVLSEARAAGCAMIGTNVDGIPEALEGGTAGLLVPPADPPALAAAIDGLLRDPEALSRWRSAASHNLAWLTIERVENEVNAIYAEGLAERACLLKREVAAKSDVTAR